MSNVRRAPPPSGSAPQGSLAALEVVKKKIAAPLGPPPAGMMTNFKGPRQVERQPSARPQAKSAYDDYDRDDRRDQDDSNLDESHDDNRYSRNRSRSGSRDSRDYDDSRDRYYSDDDGYGYNDDDDRYDDRERDYDDRDDDRSADGKDYTLTTKTKAAPSSPDGQESAPVPAAAKEVPTQDAKAVAKGAQVVNAAPRKGQVFNFQPILKSTYRELRNFVLNPCLPNVIVRCYIERNRSGSQMLAPIYSLCADLEDGTGRELAVCRKVWPSRSSHYVFSLKSDDLWRRREQRSRLYLGKLRQTGSNQYVLYDNGICPAPDEDESLLNDFEDGDTTVNSTLANGRDSNVARKMERDRKAQSEAKGAKGGGSDEVSLYRRELAVIHFNSTTRPAPPGVRGLEVCIAAMHLNKDASQGQGQAAAQAKGPAGSSSGAYNAQATSNAAIFTLDKPFKKVRDFGRQNDMYGKSLLVMHEKLSRYDPLSACLVEFKGRAHMASVKNHQLVISDPASQYGVPGPAAHEQMLRSDGEKDFVFQLGKVSRMSSEAVFVSDYPCTIITDCRQLMTASTWTSATLSRSFKHLPSLSLGKLPGLDCVMF